MLQIISQATLTAEEGIKAIKDSRFRCRTLKILGGEIKVGSRSHKVFCYKGMTCHVCGVRGKHWAIVHRFNEEGDRTEQFLRLFTADGRFLDADHLIPRSKGGTNKIQNLYPCCNKCNTGRGNQEFWVEIDLSDLEQP